MVNILFIVNHEYGNEICSEERHRLLENQTRRLILAVKQVKARFLTLFSGPIVLVQPLALKGSQVTV
jgi:hypothetical protein